LGGALAILTSREVCEAPLFTIPELGLSSGAISGRVKRGTLHRVHRGVYSLVPPESLTRESRWLAALMAVGDGSALYVPIAEEITNFLHEAAFCG
jgi:hypothetical protein